MPQLSDLNFANILAYTIFGAIGFVAFVYGKRMTKWRTMALGIALIAYPYFISSTLIIYIIGVILTAALYFWRD